LYLDFGLKTVVLDENNVRYAWCFEQCTTYCLKSEDHQTSSFYCPQAQARDANKCQTIFTSPNCIKKIRKEIFTLYANTKYKKESLK